MINFIDGKLKEILENKIVVETGGVGYDIFFPSSNFKNLPAIEENIKVFDFELGEDDMRIRDALENFGGSGLDPDKVDF